MAEYQNIFTRVQVRAAPHLGVAIPAGLSSPAAERPEWADLSERLRSVHSWLLAAVELAHDGLSLEPKAIEVLRSSTTYSLVGCAATAQALQLPALSWARTRNR